MEHRGRVGCRSEVESEEQEVGPIDAHRLEQRLRDSEAELHELRGQARLLEDEVTALRRRIQDAPKRVRTLEERLLETKGQLAQGRLAEREAHLHAPRGPRPHAALREEVEKLTQPPSALRHLHVPQRQTARSMCTRRVARCVSRSTPNWHGELIAAKRSCSTSRSTSCWRRTPTAPARS